jgi:hypothetical protein
MTQAAILGETCGRMVWVGRAVEICQMARYTRGRESGEQIIFVTLGTRSNIDMSARQRERRIAMVKRCAWPAGCSVTHAAVLREAGCHVVWIGRAVEFCQMARYTRGRESGEQIVFVTLGTRSDIDMSPGQRKLRRRVVIERCALPAGCRVTHAAILREAGCLVVWILGVNEIHEVAGCTGGRKPSRRLAILVALPALQRLVSPG